MTADQLAAAVAAGRRAEARWLAAYPLDYSGAVRASVAAQSAALAALRGQRGARWI